MAKTQTKKLTFKEAVEATADVKTCFQGGLKALQKNSTKVKLGDTRLCDGSIDLDTCTSKKYPQANRWDYIFSYKSEVYFVEVHSANSSEVSTVIKKLKWLKDWLNTQAPEIKKLKSSSKTFVWIQSGSFKILPNSRFERLAAQENLTPVSQLTLS